jgi:hypothetical protein
MVFFACLEHFLSIKYKNNRNTGRTEPDPDNPLLAERELVGPEAVVECFQMGGK